MSDALENRPQDDSYKVWTTAHLRKSAPATGAQAPTPAGPVASVSETLGVKALTGLSTGTSRVASSVYGSTYILAYEPRAKGVPLLMLEGFSDQEQMSARVKEVHYHKATLVGAYNVERSAPMRIKLLGGVVTYFTSPLSQKPKKEVAPAKAKTPEAMLRWAQNEAKKAKKTRANKGFSR